MIHNKLFNNHNNNNNNNNNNDDDDDDDDDYDYNDDDDDDDDNNNNNVIYIYIYMLIHMLSAQRSFTSRQQKIQSGISSSATADKIYTIYNRQH